MSTELFALWLLVGWCGTPWPRPWPWPDPPPEPWIISTIKIAGVVGGVVGGLLFRQVWYTEGALMGIDAAATAVGAFVGSAFLGSMFGLVTSLVGTKSRIT